MSALTTSGGQQPTLVATAEERTHAMRCTVLESNAGHIVTGAEQSKSSPLVTRDKPANRGSVYLGEQLHALANAQQAPGLTHEDLDIATKLHLLQQPAEAGVHLLKIRQGAAG